MAEKPMGSGVELPQPNVRDALKSPVSEALERLPKPAYKPPWYTSNGTHGRVCTLKEPDRRPQQYLSAAPSREEEARRRAALRRQMNTIGLWFGGVATAPGALVRLLGGSEDAVEKAAEAGWNALSPTPGAPGTPLARKYW